MTERANQELKTTDDSAEGARRLGTFGGVFTPSILTILGVVMYLLLPWTVGNLGFGIRKASTFK